MAQRLEYFGVTLCGLKRSRGSTAPVGHPRDQTWPVLTPPLEPQVLEVTEDQGRPAFSQMTKATAERLEDRSVVHTIVNHRTLRARSGLDGAGDRPAKRCSLAPGNFRITGVDPAGGKIIVDIRSLPEGREPRKVMSTQ